MINLMFAVKDKAAGAFLPPFFLPTVGMAVRTITDCVRDAKHEFARHPQDYSLYKLGSFDDNLGRFELLVEPEFVIACHMVPASDNGDLFKEGK